MRVLAAIVVPPHLTVSGGARAGEALSRSLAGYCDMTVASMLAVEPREAEPPGGAPRRLPVRCFLPPFLSSPRVPNRYKSLFYRSDIAREVTHGGYDLVHLHNPMPALEMARIARACRFAGIPYVVSTHGFNEVANGLKIYEFNRLQRAIWANLAVRPVRSVIGHAAEIFALSPQDRAVLRRLGHTGDNVTVVSNGVPPPPPADRAREDELLTGLGIEPRGATSVPTFLFLANHTPNKGLPVLLDAFLRLRAPFQLIVGGEQRPGVPYEAFQRRLARGQRAVVTGRLTDAEAAACFRRADAFVFPTLADTFPLAVLEAMSYGLAIVASEVGGIPHQLRDGCGVLVPPNDPAALAGAIAELVRRPKRMSQLGEAARSRAATEFTWEAAARIAFGRYEALVARKEASSPTRFAQLVPRQGPRVAGQP